MPRARTRPTRTRPSGPPSGWWPPRRGSTPRARTRAPRTSRSIPVEPEPDAAEATPAGSSRGDESRSAQIPNSGCIDRGADRRGAEQRGGGGERQAVARDEERQQRGDRALAQVGAAVPALSSASRRRSIPVTGARRARAGDDRLARLRGRPAVSDAHVPVGPAVRVEQQRRGLLGYPAGIQRALARTVLEYPSHRVGERARVSTGPSPSSWKIALRCRSPSSSSSER